MRTFTHLKHPAGASILGLTLVGFLSLGITSCKSPHEVTRRTEPNLDPGWPEGKQVLPSGLLSGRRGKIPDDRGRNTSTTTRLCANCHGAYAKSFAENVHRGDTCEACHGPASRHLETRGKEPGLIFSFKTGDPVVRAEACLRCHEENNCAEGARWRTLEARPLRGDLRRLPPRPLQRAAGNAGHDRARATAGDRSGSRPP